MMNSSLAPFEQPRNPVDPTLTSDFRLDRLKEGPQFMLNELQRTLSVTRLRRVYFADRSSAPLPTACVTNFPRICVPLEGCHSMELSHHYRIESIRATPGDVVFVPGNAWNKPDWSTATKVLNILFDRDHINVSLIDHDSKGRAPAQSSQAALQRSSDGTTQLLLDALAVYGSEGKGPPLDRLLAESLLHSCLQQQRIRTGQRKRKAAQTYEGLCHYLQMEFPSPVTRETVALRFGLAPNHVSRLFRQEGIMSFVDYLNMVRVSRAKKLLQESNLPLKAIATACGYQDTAYFCRVFKRICKLTPTEFRAHQAGL